MGFLYCTAIGELIYALITCRPDIAYATIKMSQYNTNPAHYHYIAVKKISDTFYLQLIMALHIGGPILIHTYQLHHLLIQSH